MFSACRPLGPLVTLNWTDWPSCSLRKPFDWIAEKCTNTSSPLAREMNPKPLASLNHFTVPCSMMEYFLIFDVTFEGQSGSTSGRNQLSETRCCVFPFQTATYPYIIAGFCGARRLGSEVVKELNLRARYTPSPPGVVFENKRFADAVFESIGLRVGVFES